MAPRRNSPIFGLTAEFASVEAILEAAAKVRDAGYRRAEAYTPFPIAGLSDLLGFHRTRVPLVFLIGGVLGAAGGYFMLWYANVVSYPWNIGGKPPHSWPAFVPITFELMVLTSAIFGLIGMLAMNGLPMLYHPLFNVPGFDLASQTRFFICIESSDATFDRAQTRRFLEDLRPIAIAEVPW